MVSQVRSFAPKNAIRKRRIKQNCGHNDEHASEYKT